MMDYNDHNWFKKDYFWIDPSDPWDIKFYGYKTDNKFSTITNTAAKLFRDDDTSDWARMSLHKCFLLLWARRRWPRDKDHEKDPKTRVGWRLRELTHWLYLTGIPKVYQFVRRMSRDPFIAFYTACTHLGDYRKIEIITMPLYIYRPNTWIWRKYLITGKKWHLRIYRCFNVFSLGKKLFHDHLRDNREIAIKNRQQYNQNKINY